MFPITDKRMTRFMISLESGIKLVWYAFQDMLGGEIYVSKIPSMKIIDIAAAISPKAKYEIIGLRPGEKLHEQMIGVDENLNTFEYLKYFKILPQINNWNLDKYRIKNGKRVKDGFSYTSQNNKQFMHKKELLLWIKKNIKKI